MKEAARIATTSEVKETQNEQQEYHWTTCPLSHQPLRPPIVSDASGKLYNKDAILEFLLPDGDGTPGTSKSDNEEVLEGRVRSLRDVVEVKFQVEELSRPQENGKTASITPRWLCPITNKPLGPGVKAVYLVPCGHAFSESALKEMAAEKCLQVCHYPYGCKSLLKSSSVMNRMRQITSSQFFLRLIPIELALPAGLRDLKSRGLHIP